MRRSYDVIITTFDRDGLAQEAVRSVLSQTPAPSQVIVVVDGGPRLFANKLREEFKHAAVIIVEQENYGTAVARNTGVALAKAEFVCFLDDDDLWHRDKLAAVDSYLDLHFECDALNHPIWWFAESESGPKHAYGFQRDFVAKDLAACHAAVEQGDPSTNSFEYLNIFGESFRRLLIKNSGTLSGAVIRRKLLISAGCFSPMHGNIDDWTAFTNVARLSEWHTIPRRLAFCRLHGGQATGNSLNAVYALAGLANTWLTGRPWPERSKPADVFKKLAEFGIEYRSLAQANLWGAIRRRDLQMLRLIASFVSLLLPRLRDRIYVWFPPQLTWRFERYILGMHK